MAGAPANPENSVPLVVRATFRSPLVLSYPVALDGILAAAVAAKEGLPPPIDASQLVPIEIPVLRHSLRGFAPFHLASCSTGVCEEVELSHQSRRPPVHEAQMFGKAKRLNQATGRDKAMYRPRELRHYHTLEWFALGDQQRILELLGWVNHVGRVRGVGAGRVNRWEVEQVAEPWAGFPVLRDGMPLRPLPQGWPGLDFAAARVDTVPLTYPYWHRRSAVIAAVPVMS